MFPSKAIFYLMAVQGCHSFSISKVTDVFLIFHHFPDIFDGLPSYSCTDSHQNLPTEHFQRIKQSFNKRMRPFWNLCFWKLKRLSKLSRFSENFWNSLTFPWLLSYFFSNFPDSNQNFLTLPWPFHVPDFFPDKPAVIWTSQIDSSNEVSHQLVFQFKRNGWKKIFRMTTVVAILDFLSELF